MVEIKIGDSHELDATFYAPANNSTAQNPIPDTNSPINLSNIAITYVITADNLTKSFGVGFVTVTPLAGRVQVLIPDDETAAFSRCKKGKRYLNFDYGGGRVESRLWSDVTFTPKKYE